MAIYVRLENITVGEVEELAVRGYEFQRLENCYAILMMGGVE